MKRTGVWTAVLLLGTAAAAHAQEAITQPIPRSEIQPSDLVLEGAFYWGENDETGDSDIYGFGGQVMFALDPRWAINLKGSWLTDSDSGVDIDVLSGGAAIAYEVIEGEAALEKTAVTVFGGLGFSETEIEVMGTEVVDDTVLYVEGGVQADLNVTKTFRVIPFFGITWVDNGDSDTILGVGGKIQIQFTKDWRFVGGLIFQFDDISEAWLVLLGVLGDLQ